MAIVALQNFDKNKKTKGVVDGIGIKIKGDDGTLCGCDRDRGSGYCKCAQ